MTKKQMTGSLQEQTRKLMRLYGLRAKKGLGQHFLIDEEVLGKIINAAQLDSEDVVVEVGPGLGLLTAELARRAGWVVAVELDDRLAAVLKESLSSFSKVSIINRNILDVKPEDIICGVGSGSYKVVANLPYYITSPVLRHFLESRAKPESMVVMVQKEVAEEITAKPGRMSLLSIGVQLYGEPVILDNVPAASFYPEPAVNSAILKITPYSRPVIETADTAEFFSLVRAGFSTARKQLVNSLVNSLGLPKMEILELLDKAGIDSRRRAETLSIEEWAHLWRIYRGEGV